VVEFLWDGDVLAGELGPDGDARCFVHEPGTSLPLLQQEQGAVFTYVNDHLGTPKELVDQDGRVAWAAAHSAWGRVVEVQRDPKAGRAVESPFRLLGQYHDAETGLCYTRFRYFDAALGRWCSPDPLGIRGGLNLFGFNGRPTIDIDPLGLACKPTQEQIDHAVANIMGLTEGQARFIMEEAFKRDSSVVFGGSRVRGNATPESDLDVGFGSLSTSQASKILKKANELGPLPIEQTRIVPGNQTENIPRIQSPEEFFQRSGTRNPNDKGGAPFSPSGSRTYRPDGSISSDPAPGK
jgi:RHS repeat-associated protein